VKELFDHYRDEAEKSGFAAGPDHLALRRRVVVAESESEARELADAVTERVTAMLSKDPRAVIKVGGAANKPVPDDTKAPASGGFVMSSDELIVGTPSQVAEGIISQCRAVGAGHFLAVLHWGAGPDEIARAHEIFGKEIVPVLRRAAVASPPGNPSSSNERPIGPAGSVIAPWQNALAVAYLSRCFSKPLRPRR